MNIYYILVTKHNDKTNTNGLTPNLKTRPKDLSSSYFLPNTSKKKDQTYPNVIFFCPISFFSAFSLSLKSPHFPTLPFLAFEFSY